MLNVIAVHVNIKYVYQATFNQNIMSTYPMWNILRRNLTPRLSRGKNITLHKIPKRCYDKYIYNTEPVFQVSSSEYVKHFYEVSNYYYLFGFLFSSFFSVTYSIIILMIIAAHKCLYKRQQLYMKYIYHKLVRKKINYSHIIPVFSVGFSTSFQISIPFETIKCNLLRASFSILTYTDFYRLAIHHDCAFFLTKYSYFTIHNIRVL